VKICCDTNLKQKSKIINNQVCCGVILGVSNLRFCGYQICKNVDNTREKGVAKMITQDKAFLERLRLLKDKSGMTTKQIAEKCDIPESTITRIFSGKTPNPTIITIMAITKAMGGTAADIFDDNAQINTAPAVPTKVLTEMEEKNLEIVNLYKGIIESKDKTIKLLTYVLLGLSAVIIFLLLFDLFNGGIGYFNK
jgi:transcriptional regulator with XRE-family HTH domain